MDLAVGTYELTKAVPGTNFSARPRKAAGPPPQATNIAEGYGRPSKPSYLNFLRIARGSLKELETRLILAERVGLLASGATPLLDQTDEVGRMLHGLITRVEAQPSR